LGVVSPFFLHERVLAGQGDQCLYGVDLDRLLEPVLAIAEEDFPVSAVEQYVVVATEQYGVVDVGKSLVRLVFVVV
jgi:hypothetical protein